MSDDGELPTDAEFGDAYALRTFRIEDGRLTSIAVGGINWEDGVCIATCTAHADDPDHQVPTPGCKCGVYAFWTFAELLRQYADWAHRIVAVVRLGELSIEGDNGVQTNKAQIIAWWCMEDDPELATACAASSPGARRYFDRDLMVGMYGLNESSGERNHGG